MHPAKVLAVLAVVCFLALVVSSPSKYPTDAEVRSLVMKSLKEKFAGLGPVSLDFQRIATKGDGVVATVEYQLIFDRSLSDFARDWEKQSPKTVGFGGKSAGMKLIELRQSFGEFKAGDVHSRVTDYLFKKVDGDWQLQK